jgi:hypothetical protein
MSGALVNLVAKGAQDAFLTGKPEVSFFQSMYKRHTNFAQFPVELQVTGSIAQNSTISVPITRKGDLLSYIWASCDDLADAFGVDDVNPTMFRLYVGGQMIEEHDAFYASQLYTKFLTNSSSKGFAIRSGSTQSTPHQAITTGSYLPLHFSCCDEYGCSLPLVALQYHDVELRVNFNHGDGGDVKFYANYIQLDTEERASMANTPREMLINQVQRIQSESTGLFDLSYFNHPVKALLWGNPLLASGTPTTFTEAKITLNGVDMFDPMPNVYFSHVQAYHHSTYGNELQVGNADAVGAAANPGAGSWMYSFALKADKYQPNGTCNFSRLDNGQLRLTSSANEPSNYYLYAVNYNIFRIQNGMGGLAFAN